jgi:hypothetical protein
MSDTQWRFSRRKNGKVQRAGQPWVTDKTGAQRSAPHHGRERRLLAGVYFAQHCGCFNVSVSRQDG